MSDRFKLSAAFFDAKYQSNPDPWEFASSNYERRRYDAILRALEGSRYDSALEPGCSIGILTEALSPICDRLLAFDFSETAVRMAAQRCERFAHVQFSCLGLEDIDSFAGFDLVVLSEIGYYFSETQWRILTTKIVTEIAPGSTLLAAHWTGTSADHEISGDLVHDVLLANPHLSLSRSERHVGFRLEKVEETVTQWHIAVLIPARNEEVLLPRCLRSVRRARLLLPAGVTSDVVVVSDSSADQTYQIAREMLGDQGCVIAADFGCVGSARIAAAGTAIDRCALPLNRCWLANTDADCEVPASWLVDQLAIALRNISAVAGIVDVDSFKEHQPRVRESFRKTYLIHADGTHPHVHGANMGVRADAYLQSGGWARLETAEDHDLWSRLGISGHTRLSDSRLQVLTSGRRFGRAPLGFAGALAAHNEVTT